MGLENVQEQEGCVLAEMYIRQVIDNDVDDCILGEDGLYIKSEDGNVIYEEF